MDRNQISVHYFTQIFLKISAAKIALES